ncbi:ALK and LTK ligand 2 [Rhynchocyon petersi]
MGTEMSGHRRSVFLGLALLLVTVGPCRGRVEPREVTERQDILNLIMEIIQEIKKHHLGEFKKLQLFSKHDNSLGRSLVTDYGVYPEEQRVEIVPRDLRIKDKFLKHHTGPIYFSPKCRKHFFRLFHRTRDCTIPNYLSEITLRNIDSFFGVRDQGIQTIDN